MYKVSSCPNNFQAEEVHSTAIEITAVGPTAVKVTDVDFTAVECFMKLVSGQDCKALFDRGLPLGVEMQFGNKFGKKSFFVFSSLNHFHKK